jgi:hypothetical protein
VLVGVAAARKQGSVSLKHGGDSIREREKSKAQLNILYEKSASLSYLSFKISPIQIYDEKDAFLLCSVYTCFEYAAMTGRKICIQGKLGNHFDYKQKILV